MANRERVVAALVLLFAGWALSGCTAQAPPELFTAITEGDLDYTKTILEENPKFVNSKDESGDTPLILAARMGNKDLCEALIANGADLQAQGQYGTALHEAAIGKHKDIVELLINNGANLEAKGENGTALHEAAIGNHKDIVELLINKGANVNAKDNSGNTPLFYASTFGQDCKRNNKNDWDIARSLLSNGAEVNMKPGSGDTPLHSAALYAPEEIVRLFLDNGADVNVKLSSSGWPRKRNSGPAPLHNACMRADKDIEIVELLIAAGADIHAKCYSEQADGWTPLYFACLHENTKAVELLLAKGAKINPISDLGNTPIHYATNVEIAQVLIDNGANIYFRNKEGCSPLHNAVKGGHSDVAKLLIANRAYVTVINNKGTSLLHEAAITKQKEMIELLIAEGVNVNAKDKAGMTPVQLAEKAGYEDIAELLRNYNAK
ncbi:MAG: ankyrin repeat domain-containing protein [Phycisphaerae bacterium]|nr:ankyrin repeat domain-containing protein [Phycisphaerae bacterium]